MVRFQRRALPKIGRFPQAVQWAKGLAGIVTGKYDVKVQVFTESSGAIYWMIDYADYEAYGKVRKGISKDSEYWGHLGRASDVFIEGSIQDTVLELID
jgi:hypothetical protein